MVPKQSWYEGGYKANIVAYTTALLRNLIKQWYPRQMLDLQKIWQKQKCPDLLMQQLTILAEKVYESITDASRPVENVTQWCKQAACWEKVKSITCDPVHNFESLLQGKDAAAEIMREARKERKLENEIDNMKYVFELGEAYWKQMDLWLRSHRLATAAETKALSYATKISAGFFPDEKQSKNLMKLREKAIAEGFPPK